MTTHDLTGLTSAEVAERTRQGLVNRVKRSDAAEYRDIVVRNVFTLFNALVIPAAIALLALGEYRGGWAVSAMAIINTLLGLAQEVRAKWHLDRLAILTETKAGVIRDGQMLEIPASAVVRDDLLCLKTGEPVVADGVVIQAAFLEVDEALLTGESDPVARHAGERLLSGSYCVAGSGVYRADQVGAASFAQSTASAARAYHYLASPIQTSINQLLRILTAVAVSLCALYVVLSFIRPTIDRTELIQMVAATITSMVPQGLVVMATLAFILGAVRMSARGAVVQRLSAVESMAAVNILCMDKTGTLTTNQLRLDRVLPLTNDLGEADLRQRLRAFASASVDRDNKSIQALRQALGETKVELLDQIPFKSQNRYSAVLIRDEGAERVLVLGACEALQPLLASSTEARWRHHWEALLPSGLRLLLFAESSTILPFNGKLDGYFLRPLGLIALSDELRPEAGKVLEELAAQGIGFKIISGDNPDTVRATVGHLELPLAHEPVVSGEQLAQGADPAELIRTHSVFGRIAPQQKLQIVSTLQEAGAHVAMIGDGVNDVLPIKRADLGIAMGEGSRASKTVSGLVLENNNFELLPATLDEGRTILRNLRRSAKLFLLKNIYTLILIVGMVLLFRTNFPYLPQQVTLLNFLTIGLPAFVITLSKERSSTASRPGFLREVGWFALRTGVILGLSGLGLSLWTASQWPSVPGAENPLHVRIQRTMLISALVLLGVTALWRVLGDGEAEPLPGDRKLRLLALAVLPVYAVALYWPLSADFFELEPLGAKQWGVILAVVGPAYGLCLLADHLWPGGFTTTSETPRPGDPPGAATRNAANNRAV